MLTPGDVYEIEMASYESEVKAYQDAPQCLKDLGWIAVPEKPGLRTPNNRFSMYGVVTGSRRQWRK